MKQIRVGVLGYGVIGRRVADGVACQHQMVVVGVAGRPDSLSLRDAECQGFDLFLTADLKPTDVAASLTRLRGTLDDLAAQVDVLLDCTPSGIPPAFSNIRERHPKLIVIVQGGEPEPTEGVSFHSMANFREAYQRNHVRVISCSSTGIARLLCALDQELGVKQGFVALARRSHDPAKLSKAPGNSLRPTMGMSHHAADVQSVLPHIPLETTSVDCPTTIAHVLDAQIALATGTTVEQVVELLDRWPRVFIGEAKSTADLDRQFQRLGRPRDDRPEIFVWRDSIRLRQQTLYLSYSVHMESITIPETIDCIRATTGICRDPWDSIHRTDVALGIEKPVECYRREAGE